jgi:hypothetical protein
VSVTRNYPGRKTWFRIISLACCSSPVPVWNRTSCDPQSLKRSRCRPFPRRTMQDRRSAQTSFALQTLKRLLLQALLQYLGTAAEPNVKANRFTSLSKMSSTATCMALFSVQGVVKACSCLSPFFLPDF